jgi:hypothetical protein
VVGRLAPVGGKYTVLKAAEGQYVERLGGGAPTSYDRLLANRT